MSMPPLLSPTLCESLWSSLCRGESGSRGGEVEGWADADPDGGWNVVEDMLDRFRLEPEKMVCPVAAMGGKRGSELAMCSYVIMLMDDAPYSLNAEPAAPEPGASLVTEGEKMPPAEGPGPKPGRGTAGAPIMLTP